MIILHIANIDSSILGGVQVAVPQMIRAQSAWATVGFLNTNGETIPGVTMVRQEGEFSLNTLTPPFNAPDLVIFHELYRPEYLRIYPVLKKQGIPFVLIPHGSMTGQAQRRKALKKKVANLLLFRRFFRSAAAIQYLSRQEADRSVFDLKHFVIGNGIPMPQRRKDAFRDDGIEILYIGRLEIEIKGLDLLVEAVAGCRKSMELANCRLRVYGPDYDGMYARLQGLIRDWAVEDLILLDHQIVGLDKERALLDADYFILTSRSEGMPMGVLEALSYGIPCILTQGTGLAGLIEEYQAGYGCETTVAGIQSAINRAIDGRAARRDQSRAAIALAESRFDQAMVARRTVDAYKKYTR